jgi:hypothetical protein
LKRLVSVFVCVFVVSLLLPCAAVRGQTSFVPHEDPEAAQSVMDAYSFLSQYADILGLVASKQYANASRLTEQLSHITVPADLSYVINRYNNLTLQLIEVLGELQITLDSASLLLNQYRLDEAVAKLQRAGLLVAKAEILLGDLMDATATLSARFGVFAAPAESKIRQAYDALQGILQRLTDLINQYHALLTSINRQKEEIIVKQLDPVALTLKLNSTSVFVGGVVAASGVLTSNGAFMQNRSVVLLLDGVQVAATRTSINGSFYAIMQIPFEYVHVMAAQALYTPLGNDTGVYLAALSPTVTISVTFYDTKLNVTIPDVAYPGLPLTVNGTVASKDDTPLGGRTVRVLFDGGLLGDLRSDLLGFFNLQTTVSAQTITGSHTVRFVVEPEGVYAGASEQKTLSVKKMVSAVNVQAPSFVLLPSEVRISGVASSATGPIKYAKVTVEFASTSAFAETLGDGSFNLTMNLPLNTVFGGSQSLMVTVEPEEPWQDLAQARVDVFVLNSVSVGLALVSSVCGAVVLYAMYRKSKSKREERKAQVLGSPILPRGNGVLGSVASKPEFRFEGLKGKVLEAYAKAVKSVELLTGSLLKSEMTLREFLFEVEPKLGDAFGVFAELTTLAEKALYSPHMPNAEDVSKAEELSGKIGRVLNR